jgi:predicted phosphodiesterase
MKYLIFSDTHLTPKFDARKFAFLKEAVSQSDQVVINGDFWEGFSNTFDAFVTSEWSTTLFPLLKKKKAVYLYGNHDKEAKCDKRTSLFSDKQAHSYSFKSGDKTFIVRHGNDDVTLPDLPKAAFYVLETLEDVLVKVFSIVFLKIAYGWMNNKIKVENKAKLKKNEVLIIGHTHLAEVDLKNNFVNAGFNKHGVGQYVFVEDGVVTPVRRKYL